MNYKEFKEKFNIKLNSQQEAAAVRTGGQTLLLAVPGSGKTTVIVARLGYMIFCEKIQPKNILTMTYNVAAAADMKKRFTDKFDNNCTEIPEFRTINGFCATVIMLYERVKNTKAFTLIEEGKATKIIKAIYIDITKEYPSESTIKEIKTKLIYCRNMMLKDEEIKKFKVGETDFYNIFIRYRQYKTDNRIMDYDDQLEFALKILIKNPDILNYYQQRYQYINIDEAQDTSKIQHMIIRLLASGHKNIFMVGDEDQSIYGFRAAYPQALLEFNKVYPQASVLVMEKNYRSTSDIVDKAGQFIKLNKYRYDKNMCTDNKLSVPVKNIPVKDHKNQYKYILKMIENNTEELAILYRNNDSAIPLIDLLEKNNIEYSLKESDGIFFSLNTTVDIINIITFALSMSRTDLFLDFYYKIGIMVKKTLISAAAKTQNSSDTTFFDTLKRFPEFEKWQLQKFEELKKNLVYLRKLKSYSAVKYILDKLEYSKYMKKHGFDNSKVNTLLSIAEQNPDLTLFLERMNILKSIINTGYARNDNKIILSTIHSSKGLEYENVLMIDVYDGIFPSVSIEPDEEKEMPKEITDTLEEERRLFYVGVTRAKKCFMILSYDSIYGEPCETALFTRQLLQLPVNKKTSVKTKKVVTDVIKNRETFIKI